MKPIKRYYLGNAEEIAAKAAAVANQGKKQNNFTFYFELDKNATFEWHFY